MAIDVDFSEVSTFQVAMRHMDSAFVMDKARPHFEKMIDAVSRNAQANIRNRSGRMRRSAVTSVEVNGGSIVAESNFTAVSDGPNPFPYPVAVEHGRRGFGPKNAKALRFESGGKVIFAKRVGPAPAQKFHERGLLQAFPRIVSEMTAFEIELATAIEGGGT